MRKLERNGNWREKRGMGIGEKREMGIGEKRYFLIFN